MLKISQNLVTQLQNELHGFIGFDCSQGACIGDCEFIIHYPFKNNQAYLAHKSEFEFKGLLVRKKEDK